MYTDTDRFRDISRDFEDAGYIVGEGRVIKRGKEASVLCCRAHPSLGVPYVALKVYKDDLWVDTEYRVLDELWEARVRVPRPYTQIGHGIIMEFVGTDDEAALPLKDVRLPAEDARRVFDEIVEAIDGMLRCGVIHGDLSAFNILYDGEHPVIIDFPQAVRVATHNDPYELFRRDVDNVQRYFERYGIERHVGGRRTLADEIWERYYLPARVGPGALR